jgi:calcium-dependent protein kinase
MYILLCGEPPFTGETEEEIFKNIKRGKFSFSQPQFNNVSDNCIDLIKQLLTSNKKYRIKASDALKHPFFTENYNPNIAMANNMDKNLLKRLLEVKKLPSKFHELIEAYLCFNFISKDEEKELRKIFRYLDRKGKNRLLKSDFAKCFEENGINATDEQIQNIFNALDSDGNNSIEYQEFLRAMCNKETLYSDKNLKAVYNSMDTDKKGYIDMDDVKKFIFQNKQVEEEKFINYLNKIGMDLKSKFEFNQFVDIIRNQKIFNHIKNSILKNTPKEEDEKNKEDININ